jgi:hypothetical protein
VVEAFLELDGWSEKKLWDWQALLFFPVSIALVASVFTQVQNSRQQEMESLRAERATVEAFLGVMGTMLLEEDLRAADEGSDVRLLARARTIAALDGVSGRRKVRLLEFLSDTQLIRHGPQGELPVISLRFANLSNTPLVRRQILSNTDLDRAELMNANLDNAKLIDTRLPGADLSDADLSDADLSGADLSGAILEGAEGVSCQQTEDAKSLEGATMPNGQKYEDWPAGKGGCKG